jgi:hypothetical protein
VSGEERFALVSRGDRVHGRVRPHPADGPSQAVLALAPDGAADHPLIERVFQELGAVASVASIDLPLCGARHSDKLSEVAFDERDPVAARLRPDLEQQLAADLAATLDYLKRRLGLRDPPLVLAIGPRPALCAGLPLPAGARLLSEPEATPRLFSALRAELKGPRP